MESVNGLTSGPAQDKRVTLQAATLADGSVSHSHEEAVSAWCSRWGQVFPRRQVDAERGASLLGTIRAVLPSVPMTHSCFPVRYPDQGHDRLGSGSRWNSLRRVALRVPTPVAVARLHKLVETWLDGEQPPPPAGFIDVCLVHHPKGSHSQDGECLARVAEDTRPCSLSSSGNTLSASALNSPLVAARPVWTFAEHDGVHPFRALMDTVLENDTYMRRASLMSSHRPAAIVFDVGASSPSLVWALYTPHGCYRAARLRGTSHHGAVKT